MISGLISDTFNNVLLSCLPNLASFTFFRFFITSNLCSSGIIGSFPENFFLFLSVATIT